jgi:hypothetical protein
MLLKKSLYGVCHPLAKKSTSQIDLQTAREHRLRVRRLPKTLRERRSATFSTASATSGPLQPHDERLLMSGDLPFYKTMAPTIRQTSQFRVPLRRAATHIRQPIPATTSSFQRFVRLPLARQNLRHHGRASITVSLWVAQM